MCQIRGAELLAGIAARTEPNDGELARRISASAPHNASVIEDPAEHWTGGGNFTRHVCRELDKWREHKGTRMAFGTINI